ncbi:putative protein associated with differentiation 4 [Trypanosoma cruzi]|uniref:Uncharacterized protein n=1 Tax=Trypanosoma cruzi TaxID=5693 RepID=A0A2V2WYE6_TRYCR|nr:putative protein associated with differentiation 4 [Trypanosoma cruzi]
MALPVSCLERRETQREEDDCGGTERPSAGDEVANEPAVAGGPPKKVETDVDYIAPAVPDDLSPEPENAEVVGFPLEHLLHGGHYVCDHLQRQLRLRRACGRRGGQRHQNASHSAERAGSAAGRLLMSYFEVWSQKRKAEDRGFDYRFYLFC